MKFYFNKNFCGFEVVFNIRKYRIGSFLHITAPWIMLSDHPPITSRRFWIWFCSRFVFFGKQSGLIGNMFVIEKQYRILNFVFGYREYNALD